MPGEILLTALGGVGTAALGFFTGAVQQRSSREHRLEQRLDKELAELRKEVEKCRVRDRQMVVVSVAMKMLIPEVLRIDPRNPVLNIIADAMRAVPVDGGDFDGLLARLDEIPGAKEFGDDDQDC